VIPVAVAIVSLTTLLPAAAPTAEDASGHGALAREGSTTIAPLQAREVIERLKTMRAQLLLEQEYNRILEARLERQELETKLGIKESKDDKPKVELPRTAVRPPPKLETSAEQISVKAVTVAPFKEAIVTYRGRVYTVRPGDKLGDTVVRDINESGIVTAGGRSAVMLGQ
jgi:hypothetical protein